MIARFVMEIWEGGMQPIRQPDHTINYTGADAGLMMQLLQTWALEKQYFHVVLNIKTDDGYLIKYADTEGFKNALQSAIRQWL